ncbi:MAG: hypothetical protein ACU0CC_11885 [Sagittula sp.]|jgi:hypothetical protein|uniref:hypothetical protein n=1 Tax=unclassified Sagittula TaxID=2624628 RepID=UPI0012FD3683|nr:MULTISPECIES: hypothetical protein [unclassified Sagittula]WHZ35307.1 hypothetical protein QNI11_22130 [Sagittula sp. MA-2]
MILGLLIPTAILIALAVFVTRGVERLMPETIPGIAAAALLSALALVGLSACLFAVLYLLETPSAARLIGQRGGVLHFLLLGVQAGLVWGPIVLLVSVTAPRRWRTNVW